MAKRAKAAGPKGPKKNPRTKKDAPGAMASPAAGHNSGDDGSRLSFADEQALFTKHRQSWQAHENKQKLLDEARTKVVAALKNDGFTIKQMQIADQLQNPKGEKRVSEEVKDRLKVARWIGHPMGNQLDLFNQPNRRPIDEEAFEEGVLASQENKSAKPPYDPGHPRYQPWMKGYAQDQERIKKGFKQLDPEKAPGVTSKDGDEVQGGTPVARSEHLKTSAAEGDQHIADVNKQGAEEAPAGTSKH